MIVSVVVNGAASVAQLAPVPQVPVSAVPLARSLGARSRYRHYGENDSGEA